VPPHSHFFSLATRRPAEPEVSVLTSPRSFLGHLQQRALRVQLIDGDAVARLRVADYLRAAGLQVQEAADAPGALLGMWQARPDVMVLDPAVPWSRALVACCRRDARLAGVPVLLLSRVPKLGQAVRDLRARAGLAKPIDLDVLLAILRCVAGCGAQRSPHVCRDLGWAAAACDRARRRVAPPATRPSARPTPGRPEDLPQRRQRRVAAWSRVLSSGGGSCMRTPSR
jgi:DNA-binding response OmpR family regulator